MEVCVDSVTSAINAERGGAIRVELCSSLAEGGTTPSIGTVQVIKQKINIPVFVMIRPRGGDFVYDEDDFEIMKQDILALKSVGADGFVLGILRMDGSVDAQRCRELLELIRPQPATFHRAIDMTNNIEKALETIIGLRFERILSSGGENSVLEGLPVLENMIKQAAGRITIMPGGGINERNLRRILEGCRAKEFHASARSAANSLMSFRKEWISMGSSNTSEYSIKVTDSEKVRKLVAISGEFWTDS